MISLVTNVDSLIAQQNLRVNSNFQSQTIQQLTSGYRINSSADDAAGLAVANSYRNNIAELSQGVRNANDGVSQLQIIDGGLSNISQILDRMKTLATESASSTFTGDRTTLNNEFQSLVQEVNRQASNIGLSSTVNTNNTTLNVYIGGGGKAQTNSQVTVDLSGAANRVDSTGLGLSASSLLPAGTIFGSVNLNGGGNILASTTQYGDQQQITVNLAGGTQVNATISSTSTAGITTSNAVQQLNNQLSSYGISASVDTASGNLMLSGNVAFTAKAGSVYENATNGTATATVDPKIAAATTTGLVAAADVAVNKGMYRVDQGSTTAPVGSFSGVAGTNVEALTFTAGGNSVNVSLTATNAGSAATAVQYLNNQLSSLGISAVIGTGGDIQFQSANSFTVAKADHHTDADGTGGGGAGVFAANFGGGTSTAWGDTSLTPSVSGSASGNSLSALTAITSAVSTLGLVQGRVGAGENKLGYAINLAQSQISSFSAAQSQIRDTDVAAQAANLTKGQVLQQASIAAMAQANAEPQSVLALLKA